MGMITVSLKQSENRNIYEHKRFLSFYFPDKNDILKNEILEKIILKWQISQSDSKFDNRVTNVTHDIDIVRKYRNYD